MVDIHFKTAKAVRLLYPVQTTCRVTLIQEEDGEKC